MPRAKKRLIQPPSREEAQELMLSYAKSTSKLKALEAKIEQAVQVVRKKYEGDISTLQADQSNAFELLQAYALHNQEAEFSKKKSQDWAHGRIGFRTSTPKAKPRKGFTWNAIKELLSKFDPSFIRTKTEPDKEKIIASRDDADLMEYLHDCGVEVVQDDTFFIEPKEEELS